MEIPSKFGSVETGDNAFSRSQMNYKQSLVNQLERVGNSPSGVGENTTMLAIKFALNVSILEAMLSPYLDKEYIDEIETDEYEKLSFSKDANDQIQFSVIKLHSLMRLMERLNLLLTKETYDFIDVSKLDNIDPDEKEIEEEKNDDEGGVE